MKSEVMAGPEQQFLTAYRSKLYQALDRIDLDQVERVVQLLKDARANNRHIFTCGNGGSASTASHFVTDMVKGASYLRDQRFRIMALTDSMPTITAYSNDVSYDCVFTEQLKNFAEPGDVLIAISGSGNSPNVVCAIEYARSRGCSTVALTGRDGGKLGRAADVEVRVAEEHMGRIEDAHLIICHMICYYFMEN
ncbi:MAG: SIS domain-containing protein [Acidobacteriaceae bacterium]|nr:SIS domain-containing protein [Acidobacteriaceae bacterium]